MRTGNMKAVKRPVTGAIRKAAAEPRAPPMAHPRVSIRLTLMPMRRLASGLVAAALMARPTFVRVKNHDRRSITAREKERVPSSCRLRVKGPRSTAWSPKGLGKYLGSCPRA
jgi:hypothetical protein